MSLVMFLIGWIVSYERYEQEVAAAEKNLPFFIERGELERAESLVRKPARSVPNAIPAFKSRSISGGKRSVKAQRQEDFSQRT